MATQIKRNTDKRVAKILTTFDQLEKKRAPFEPTWQEITQYEHPRINNFKADHLQGKKRTNYILDSTPQRAIRTASDGYQAYMFPRSTPWWRMGLVEEELVRPKANKKWLEDCERVVYAELARSDFYQECGQVIDNGLSICTSTCYVEDHKEKSCSEYLALHPKEAYIARDRYGLADTLYRRYLLTNRVILDTFGDTIERYASKQTLKKIEDNPHTAQPVLHSCFPRTDRLAKVLDATDLPWASTHILEEDQCFLRESGYHEFPFAVWCPRVNTDEDYGRGPGWDALPDSKRLQVATKWVLQAMGLQARAPVMYPQELENELDQLIPGGQIPYRDFSRRIVPIETSLNLEYALEIIKQIQDMIRDHFDVPFFLMFSMREKLQKTATEVAEIAGERAALMGTMVGRLETDFLDVVLELSIRNAARDNRLPPPPPALRQANPSLKFEYIGPLATLQKRYHGQQNMVTTFAQAMPFLEAFPQAKAVINSPSAIRKLLVDGGFPAEGLNEEKETKAIIAAMNQAAQQQQSAALAGELGKVNPELLEQAGGSGLPARTRG